MDTDPGQGELAFEGIQTARLARRIEFLEHIGQRGPMGPGLNQQVFGQRDFSSAGNLLRLACDNAWPLGLDLDPLE